VHAVPETSLEAIAVEQRQEKLEVFFFAIVRCSREEQEMLRPR